MHLFSKNEILTWLGIGIALILPTFYAIPFCFPQADDFGYAELALNHEWTNEFSRLYFEWSGRYTSIVAGFLSPLSFGLPAFYSIAIFLISFFFVLSNNLMFQVICHQFKSKLFSFIISLLFTSLFFNLLPSPGESIYWYSGIITYLLPSAFLQISIFFYGLFFIRKNWLFFPLGAVFLILALGGNEILTSLSLLLSFLFIWILKRLDHENFSKYSYIVLTVLIASGIMLVAPGNSVRSDMFENERGILSQLVMTDIQIVRFLFSWLSNVSTWILFIVTLFIGQFAKQKEYSFKILNGIPTMVFLIMPFVILYASIFPAYYTMGILGQHRTLAPGLFFFLLWFLFYGARIGYRSQLIALFFGSFQKNLRVLAIVFLGVMFFSGNNKVILNDLLSGKFESYFEANITRYKAIEHSKSGRVEFEAFKSIPESFEVMDIKADSSHWINQNWARYHKLDEVILKE